MFCLFKEGPHKQRLPIKYKYSKCGSRHHTTICSKSLVPDKTTDNSTNQTHVHLTTTGTTPSQPQASKLNPDATILEIPTTVSMYIDSNKTVLLQTARTCIYGVDRPELSMEI